MDCPVCGEYGKTYASKPLGAVKIRYRQCEGCGHKYRTFEELDSNPVVRGHKKTPRYPLVTPAITVRIQEELDDAIRDFWAEADATWRIVCLNSSEWLLHRTAALQDDCFAALPLGCNADGSAHASQYGLCRVNRTRATRHR